MEQTLPMWSQKTKSIYNSVLLFAIGYLIYSILLGFDALWSTGSVLTGGSGGVNFFTILRWLVLAAVVVGYILFIKGLGELRNLLNPSDGNALGQVRMAAMLLVLTTVLAFFNLPGWISGIINIVAYVMMMMGYNTLKKSEALPVKAKSGFSQLFISMLLVLISMVLNVVFSWIPILNILVAIVCGILVIVSYVMIITGWCTVKNSPAPLG